MGELTHIRAVAHTRRPWEGECAVVTR